MDDKEKQEKRVVEVTKSLEVLAAEKMTSEYKDQSYRLLHDTEEAYKKGFEDGKIKIARFVLEMLHDGWRYNPEVKPTWLENVEGRLARLEWATLTPEQKASWGTKYPTDNGIYE